MDIILDNISKLQTRKNILTTMLNIFKYQYIKINEFTGRINKSFNISIDLNNKSAIVNGNNYNTVHNIGGGDCFFHSIIDSNIPMEYEGTLLNDRYKNNKQQFITKLREITIQTIIDKQIINYGYDDQAQWHNEMKKSSYWADDYMLSALCETFSITPVLIESNNHKIYCGQFNKNKYEGKSTIKYSFINKTGVEQTENRYVNFNDIDKLKQSNDRFVIIYYQTMVHYEVIYVKNNDIYIRHFNGFNEFETYNKNLAQHIIKNCEFNNKKEAEEIALRDLLKGLKSRGEID